MAWIRSPPHGAVALYRDRAGGMSFPSSALSDWLKHTPMLVVKRTQILHRFGMFGPQPGHGTLPPCSFHGRNSMRHLSRSRILRSQQEKRVAFQAARIAQELEAQGDPLTARGAARRVRREDGVIYGSVSEAARANGVEKVDNVCQAIQRGGRCARGTPGAPPKGWRFEYFSCPPDTIIRHAMELVGAPEDMYPAFQQWDRQINTAAEPHRVAYLAEAGLRHILMMRGEELVCSKTSNHVHRFLPPKNSKAYDPIVPLEPDAPYGVRAFPSELRNLLAERDTLAKKIEVAAKRDESDPLYRGAVIGGLRRQHKEVCRRVTAYVLSPLPDVATAAATAPTPPPPIPQTEATTPPTPLPSPETSPTPSSLPHTPTPPEAPPPFRWTESRSTHQRLIPKPSREYFRALANGRLFSTGRTTTNSPTHAPPNRLRRRASLGASLNRSSPRQRWQP